MAIYLYETTAATDASGGTEAVRLTTGEGYNDPSAPGFFEGRIKSGDDISSGLTVERTVFSGGKLGGGDLTFGVVNVVNPDGDLDRYLDYGFGRPATLKLGEQSALYGSFTPVLTATAGQITLDSTTLSIGWTSRMAELDHPACPATFAGTNSGTTGLEGTADDIKGSAKPWAMGVLRGITPVQLNSSTRIFGWNFGSDGTRAATHSLDGVRFRGALWTLYTDAPGSTGGDYATAAALQAALAGFSVTQGYYVTCLAESLAVMGGSNLLNGDLAFDVTIEAAAAQRYAGALWKACLLRAGVASADIDAGTLAALSTAAPYQAGYYAQSESFRSVADALAASVAACYLPDQLGVYRIWQMTAPSGSPVARFKRLDLDTVQGPADGDLISLTPASAGSDWTPVKQVRVQYARNWTPLNAGNVASAVSAEDLGFLTAEWRYTAPLTSAEAAAKYLNATSQDYVTYLADAAGANAIAAVLLALYGALRREYTAVVTYGQAFALLLELGAVVHVTSPKFGLSGGRLASIHGIRLKDTTEEAELTLWF